MDVIVPAAELERAPRPVREWIAAMLLSQLSLQPEPGAGAEQRPALAALSPEEAVALFERLRADYLACQVLLELGRDNPAGAPDPAGLHRLSLADIMHYVRLGSPQELFATLERLARAAAEQSGGDVPLYVADQAGNLYVSKPTQQSLKALWHQIVTDRYADLIAANPSGPSMPLDASASNPAART